jgi:hypothetical protein
MAAFMGMLSGVHVKGDDSRAGGGRGSETVPTGV